MNAWIAAVLGSALVAVALARVAAADELVMFEQQACPYCAAWNRDIGPVYPKTDEAKLLPLRRVDIAYPRPPELRAVGAIAFTPTFVVVHCGREVARMTGYTSTESFWEQLDEAVKRVKAVPCPASAR